jgi:hypothetical protein
MKIWWRGLVYNLWGLHFYKIVNIKATGLPGSMGALASVLVGPWDDRPWPCLFNDDIWPIHFNSSLLELSVWGLCKRTELLTLNSLFLTFGSLQDLVSSWYFYKLVTTLSLFDSNKSFSLTSVGHGGASIVVHRLWCLISLGNTACTPNNSLNGVKLVDLQTVVLWLHTALSMTSAHFPFFSPSRIFLIASKIKALAHSTAPSDCGWYTDVKETFVPTWWQKSLNMPLSMYLALSTVICCGTP